MEGPKCDLESESCSSTVGELIEVAQIESELKSWNGSTMEEFKAVKIERKCQLSTWPNWKCILCKKTTGIAHGAVYQVRRANVRMVLKLILYALVNPVLSCLLSFLRYDCFGTCVFQCQQGHLACYACSRHGQSCEICSRAVSRIRNLVVEDMIRSTVVTCKFATLGCTEVLKFKDLTDTKLFEHEKLCSFAPMICPMPGCHQAGVENLFTKHVLTDHSDIWLIVDLEYCSWTWKSKEFELDSSTNLVLLTLIGRGIPNEFYLLHQESTRSDDVIHLTSLTKCSKRHYNLDVKVSKNLTYSFEGNLDMDQVEVPSLLIPKDPGGHSLTKKCNIRMHKTG